MDNGPRGGANRSWEKRQAIQVASLLPEDRESALRVLGYAKELVENWWTLD